jgi:hypothetical protein
MVITENLQGWVYDVNCEPTGLGLRHKPNPVGSQLTS